ncbi:SUF system NifU family Fe-S cluster assembly protein [Clostridium sp. 19966]|uniref:Fe-S cluster assembly sulfur transfer protein SufU n=1 Tax=Clostridium sp. 19966 TaxID=2768166 RepID=UPI0028DF9684|nr:SUF system NifU family Fe-S cluster assembly protein [Clostridium sp. 19966]MDT8718086.1 SUF system NifU family Fe-S cluster assembly protein [Clostridium sp. 19966]
MDLSSIYTELIAEHNSSTRNKRKIDNPDMVMKGKNPSCGDEIELQLKIKDDLIEDAAFTGIGCAISQASASMMIDLIKGKTVEEAEELIHIFLGMIKREIVDDEKLEVLDEAIAMKNISNMPARVKCAVLSWHTLEDAIKNK